MQVTEGPFGPARLREQIPAGTVEAMYRRKCDATVDFSALAVETLDLYECERTGTRFWRPERLAGDEAFYQQLSRKWPNYYHDWRWEYGPALKQLRPTDRLLEVGCGRGTFLRHTQGRVREAAGLELNREAIADKVTDWPVLCMDIASLAAAKPASYDVVCSYQVLEHVVDPAGFLRDCLACLRPGGRLIVSTPDPENDILRAREDAFDLPPHHMNHFTLDSYRRIAELLGVRLLNVARAPVDPWGTRPPGTRSTDGLKATWRRNARNLVNRMRGKRGPTLMVTLGA